MATDPRKFSWTLDTLTNPRTDQSGRFDIWGSSETDVYTIGFVDAGGGEMWHYNGGQWKSIPLHINQGGFLTIPFSLNAIEGFSRTNIYAGGSNDVNYPVFQSLILHFNGIEWKEVNTPNVGVVINLTIIHINEIYGGSAGKSYLHFDGATWTKDSVNIVTPPNALTRFTGFGEYNNQTFCFFEYVKEDGTSAVYYFLRKNATSWAVVDSFIIDQSHYNYKWGDKLKNLPDGLLYSFGSSSYLQRYNGSSWETVFNEKYIHDIYGLNSNNMFAVGYPGKAFHFNGTDWYEIGQLKNPNLVYSGVWFNGKEAFICGNSSDYPQRSIVWHGRK